jgi:hypothetical protein
MAMWCPILLLAVLSVSRLTVGQVLADRPVIIWAICGVGIVTLIIAVITEAYSKRYQTAVTRRSKNPDTPGLPQLLDGLSKDQPPVVQRQAAAELPHEVCAAECCSGWL